MALGNSILLLLCAAVLAAVAVFWPRIGVYAALRRWREAHERMLFEDALKHLLDFEHQGQTLSHESLGGAMELPHKKIHLLIERMEAAGLCRSVAGAVELTNDGRRWALQVLRAHRLWERYLADEARLPISKVHVAAHRAEHGMTADQIDALDAHLGHPATDPHGDPIPTAAGVLQLRDATCLPDWPLGTPASIVHIEDEPPVSFEQIMATGLRPGRTIRIVEHSPQRLVVSDGQDEYTFAPVVATNIQVTAAPEVVTRPKDIIPLSDLKDGEEADIVELDPDCRGFTRRRLLDFGLTPSTRVRADLATMFGDPRAYRVRGTMVALRREQAAEIWVRAVPAGKPAAAQEQAC